MPPVIGVSMDIDENRLKILAAQPVRLPTARELRREGRVFFVGGELPVNETLETMFASFCTESTDLFYLSFGGPGTIAGGLELARQIRKNFNVRLMARFDYPIQMHIVEHAYAAGVDIIDITSSSRHGKPSGGIAESLRAARSVFPRWSVVSTLSLDEVTVDETSDRIDALLYEGIVPLAAVGGAHPGRTEEIHGTLRHLAAGWNAHHVTIKPLIPLIAVTMPFVPVEAGRLRGFIDRLEERRLLAAADLRRHLRVQVSEDSLDSAAL